MRLHPLPATIGPSSSTAIQHGYPELRLSFETPGAVDGTVMANVSIYDLSASGLLIETALDLVQGQRIWFALPEDNSIAGEVIWISGKLFGCRFDAPLTDAALNQALSYNPQPSPAGPIAQSNHAYVRDGFPEHLRRLRQERGWSLSGLARRAGLSKPSIWAWECGRTRPRHKSLRILEQVFGLPENALSQYNEVGLPSAATLSIGSGPALSAVVDSSRKMIAETAGVKMQNVKIVVEY